VREGAAALARAAVARAREGRRAEEEREAHRAEKVAYEGRLRAAHAALEAARGEKTRSLQADLRALDAVRRFEADSAALRVLREKHLQLEERLEGALESVAEAEELAASKRREVEALTRRVDFLEGSLQEAQEVAVARELDLQKAKELARQTRGYSRKSENDVWKVKANRMRSEVESLRNEVSRLRAMKTYR